MPDKRRILDALTRERLLEFARLVELPGLSGKSKVEIVHALASAKRARLRDLLPELSRDELKEICLELGLEDHGREKQVLIDRIFGREADDDEPPLIPPGATPQLVDSRSLLIRPSTSDDKEQITRTSLKSSAHAKATLDPVSDYRHDGQTRKNNPPASLAAEGTVPVLPKTRFDYSPRRPPELRFDPSGDADKLPELLAEATKRKLTPDEARLLGVALRTHEPWLEWAGKRETQERGFDVDPVALHIHERVSAQAILKVAAREDVSRDLFADPQQDYQDAVQFYQHDIDWTNRLILGDRASAHQTF